MRRNKGITLIALIISIIILIILSAVTLSNITGEDGLIDMATDAAKRTQIEEYKYELYQIRIDIMAENANEYTYERPERDYLERFKEKIDTSEMFKDNKSVEIIRKAEGETEDKLRIVTKEGYVFDVTDNSSKYAGKLGEEGLEPLPEIKEGSISIELEEGEQQEGTWTKGPLHATITLNEEKQKGLSGLTIQYAQKYIAETEGTSEITDWKNYTKGSNIEITTNGTIYLRVKNNIGDISETLKTASITINNIDTINPEKPTELKTTDVATNSIEVTASAKDRAATEEKPGEQSGIAKIKFELTGEIKGTQQTVAEEENVTTEDTTEVSATHTFTELTQGKNYTITVKAVDKAGNESEQATLTLTKKNPTFVNQVTSANYGQYINYPVDLGIGSTGTKDDWKIFYKGKNLKNEECIFIIAADCVPNTNKKYADMEQSSTYNAYWGSLPSSLDTNYNADTLKLFSIKNSYPLTNDYANSRCVSKLLATKYWTDFSIGTYADCAIGGPTLEMWCASWNEYLKVHQDSSFKELEAVGSSGGKGYYVSSGTSGNLTNLYMNGTQGFLSDNLKNTLQSYYSLYFPHKASFSNCNGYWLASPSAYGGSNLVYVDFGGNIGSNSYYYVGLGIRPVVCLKSEVSAEKDGDGVWQLQ